MSQFQHTVSKNATRPVLSAEHVTKHYPVSGFGTKSVVHAADDVSLDLFSGQVVALVGESGSGKSTIAKLLAQLEPITSGAIRLDGKEVKVSSGHHFRAYASQVQMIFQDPFGSLNSIHTVNYILGRALQIHHRHLHGDRLDQAVKDLLTRVKLTPAERYCDKFPHELSGGQRQRVSIARALAADPKILLADEPISMLDVSIRLGILNLLAELRDKDRIAILYITHDVASARYFADETLVMYAGRIVERGDSETVTQQPAHPYTALLVGSAPDIAHAARGEAPSLISPPSGCRFRTRCPFATEMCARVVPKNFTAPSGQQVACWLYSDEAGTPQRGSGDLISQMNHPHSQVDQAMEHKDEVRQ